MSNSIVITGNVGQDPEMRFTANGIAVCRFSVASSKREKKDGEWVDGPTTWFSVTCWRTLAENVAESVTKGSKVVVTGEVALREYEARDGTKRTSLDVTAQEVALSLAKAPAKAMTTGRTQRSTSEPTQAFDDPWLAS